ncbi:hypothetical protein BpHYR1_007887 [Brachionus plicatilis]|uniref:Uncharacterized protein n=1 Tax=Brachionus plicatilis TaxID=10195 RepID=A0A3M7RDC4_BRAPC|nr:hypothetical protein BpHYR1_007887 [Brachionus plicatilis]
MFTYDMYSYCFFNLNFFLYNLIYHTRHKNQNISSVNFVIFTRRSFDSIQSDFPSLTLDSRVSDFIGTLGPNPKPKTKII